MNLIINFKKKALRYLQKSILSSVDQLEPCLGPALYTLDIRGEVENQLLPELPEQKVKGNPGATSGNFQCNVNMSDCRKRDMQLTIVA